MAYRQLCALTFVTIGLALAACGGDGVSSAASPSDGLDDGVPGNANQPPANSNRAPGNANQPPGNANQPPGNPDQPPGNGSSGGAKPPGGNACEAFCDEYGDDCPGNNTANAQVRQLCGRGCGDLLGGQCAAAVGTLLTCVVALPGLCTEPGPSNGDLLGCAAAFDAWSSCDDADDDGPPAQSGCTQAGGCACGNPCTDCICRAGTDNAALTECATTGACAAP